MVVIDAALKSSVILAGSFFALWILRRSSAAMRHLVLAAGLAIAALSPAVTLMVPGWRVDFPAISSSPAAVPSASVEAAGPALSTAFPVAAAARTPAATRIPELTAQHVYTVWLAGSAIALLLLAAGFVRLAWVARQATRASQPWMQMLDRVASHYALRTAPRLLQSRHPSLLVTWGVLRPAVLLPVAAPVWSDERMRVVLEHELAHVARRDWAVQIGAELVRCLYWFNPLVWIACRRLRQESEQACDDQVLASGHAGTAYAAHLLDLARAFRTSDRISIPAVAIARPSSLERRVAAMLTSDVNRQPVNLRSAAATLLLLLALALPVASFDAFAQARFTAISGTLTDPTGGVLYNATVALTNTATNAKFEVRSNRTGFYEVTPLPAGSYEIEIHAPGFIAHKESVTLGVGETLQRNASLSVSNLQETITVAANDDPVQVREAGAWPTRKPCADPSIGGCLTPPLKLKDVRPMYPTALRDRGIEGPVRLNAVIDTLGKVKDVRVVSSAHPELEQLAIDAVSQWEFTDTLLNGRPIEVTINTDVYFGAKPSTQSQRP